MVDCQFQLGGARVGIAADPDLLSAIARFLVSMGADVVAAVASSRADRLSELPIDSVVIGDLADLEWLSREHSAELIVANSHGVEIAKRLRTALLRAGFPIYDSYGAHARAFVGYAGTRQTLFEIANLLAGNTKKSSLTGRATGRAPSATLKPRGTPHAEDRVSRWRPASPAMSARTIFS